MVPAQFGAEEAEVEAEAERQEAEEADMIGAEGAVGTGKAVGKVPEVGAEALVEVAA